MRVLVTGAGGMVGRNLLAHPAASQFELLTPTRRELDLLDRASIDRYLDETRPDTVIHMAAVVGGIQANIEEPVRFLVDNVTMATNLLPALRAHGVKRLLNLASSCMYPRNIEDVLHTGLLMTAPLEPTNEGYALAKIVSMRLAEYMVREDPTLCYRTAIPCNLYGLYDHFDLKRSHMVPAAIMKVVGALDRDEPSVSIWGDGTARREFMFSSDLADFLFWAITRLEDLPSMLNVGTGRDYSVREYYECIAKVAGYEGRFDYDVSKPTGMRRKLLDVSEVESLGWRSQTSLEDGVAQTIAYFRSLRAANAA